MTPEQWAALVRLNLDGGSGTVLPIPGYGARTIRYGSSNAALREAAATPLPALPLAVPGPRQAVRRAGAGGRVAEAWKGSSRQANEWQATLVPNARFFAAHDSGHDIHQDQPALVAEAIRQVVAGVRDPDTWYDLTSCCVRTGKTQLLP